MFSIQLSSIVKKEIAKALMANKAAILGGLKIINAENYRPKFDLLLNEDDADNSLMPLPLKIKDLHLKDEELKALLPDQIIVQNLRFK